MTEIRAARVEDIPAIVEMGLRFLDEEYAGAIHGDPERIRQMTERVIDSGGMFLAERHGRVIGMIGMLVYDHFFSGERVASPICWWVNPEARGYGLRLLRVGKRWSREQGATRIQASAPNAKSEEIYKHLGFERFEVHYQRDLT